MTVLYIPLETTVLEGIQGQFNSMKENAVPGQILFFICCITSSNNRIRLVPALTYIVIIPATRELRLVPALTSSILYCDHTSNKGTTVSSSFDIYCDHTSNKGTMVSSSFDIYCDHTSNKGTTVSSSSAFILVSAIRELQLVTCTVVLTHIAFLAAQIVQTLIRYVGQRILLLIN